MSDYFIVWLTQRYEPTDSPTEADVMLSPSDLLHRVQQQVGDNLTLQEMTEILTKYGFSQFEFENLKSEWMLKKKQW